MHGGGHVVLAGRSLWRRSVLRRQRPRLRPQGVGSLPWPPGTFARVRPRGMVEPFICRKGGAKIMDQLRRTGAAGLMAAVVALCALGGGGGGGRRAGRQRPPRRSPAP